MRRYSGLVFATARRVTQDAALAEEVAQDTFLALAKRGHEIQESVAAWLHHVAWQNAANAVRGELRRRHREQRAGEALHEFREDCWSEMEPLIDSALDALPADLRSLIVEHYLGQRTQQEIALHHGLSQSTVSRQLDKGLRLLREELRRKGVVAGLGFGSLLTANVIEAAPASLTPSLAKLSLSGIGAGSRTLARLGEVAAMKGAWLAALPVALLVAAAAYEVCSEQSLLTRWLSASDLDRNVNLSPQAERRGTTTAGHEERWAAEARRIWANAPRIRLDELLGVSTERFFEERDTAKRLAVLHSVGVSLSHATLESLTERHVQHKWRAGTDLWIRACEAFFMEQPREAVAWAFHLIPSDKPGMKMKDLEALNWVLASMTANTCEPGAWAAFLAASPDPRVAEYAERWRQISADPATLWSRAQEFGASDSDVERYILRRLETLAPDRALELLLCCPGADFRARAIVGLAPRLAADQLQDLADEAFGANASLNNLLRAMAGGPGASYGDAAAFAMSARSAVPYDPAYDEWAAQCLQQVYNVWAGTDPIAGMKQAMESEHREYLERFMTVAAGTGSLTDEFIHNSLSETKPERRDAALAEFYRGQAKDDPWETLRRISASPFIEDQVEAAKPILTDWSKTDPEAAADWLRGLPIGGDRAELAARIASEWVDRDPEATVAYMRSEGVRLRRCYGALAFSLRHRGEEQLRSLWEPLRGDPEFDKLVVALATYRVSEPLMAFDFISRHAGEGWQTLVVADAVRWLNNGDSRAEDYVQALPVLDLNSVPLPQMTTAAEMVAQAFQKEGRSREAFDWAMRIRSATAPQARAAAIRKLAAGGPGEQRLLSEWISQARLCPEESASLLGILNTTPQGSAQ
jgi:RNA polymerase sigma factor (sigma-70 family)